MTAVPDAVEALLLVSVSTVPGTDLKALGQQLADAVVSLPVPAAALIGAAEVPEDIAAYAQKLGEQQGTATAAADTNVFFARLWFHPSSVLPADGIPAAIACREVWEEHVEGVDRSGVLDVVCLPAPSPDGWLRGAARCRSVARTAGAKEGLIPEMGA